MEEKKATFLPTDEEKQRELRRAALLDMIVVKDVNSPIEPEIKLKDLPPISIESANKEKKKKEKKKEGGKEETQKRKGSKSPKRRFTFSHKKSSSDEKIGYITHPEEDAEKAKSKAKSQETADKDTNIITSGGSSVDLRESLDDKKMKKKGIMNRASRILKKKNKKEENASLALSDFHEGGLDDKDEDEQDFFLVQGIKKEENEGDDEKKRDGEYKDISIANWEADEEVKKIHKGDFSKVEVALTSNTELLDSINNNFYLIIQACKYNNTKILSHYLREEKNKTAIFDYRDETNATFLHLAVKSNSYDVCKLFLDNHFIQSVIDEKDCTPLHWACQLGYGEIVKLLISYPNNAIEAQAKYGTRPLHLSARSGSVLVTKILLENGANINSITSSEFTPLHLAVMKNKYEIVKELLSSKNHNNNACDANAKTKDDLSALHLSIMGYHPKIVKVLLEYKSINVNVFDNKRSTPLHYAAKFGYEDIVQLLLESKATINGLDGYGRTALHRSCAKGYFKVTKILLENGANLHIIDCYESTPLYYAERNNFKQIIDLIKSHEIKSKKNADNAANNKSSSEMFMEISKFTSQNKKRLDMSSMGLATVPLQVFWNIQLTDLALSHNHLKVIPPEIDRLFNLTKLNVSTNGLLELPKEIGVLTSLKILEIQENQLLALPPQIKKLTKMENLSIDFNRLTIFPIELCFLSSLKVLRLDNNSLLSIPEEISRLKSLRELNLDSNKLTSLPLEIGSLTSLYSFSIENNLITKLPKTMGRLINLSILRIEENPIDFPPADILSSPIPSLLQFLRNELLKENNSIINATVDQIDSNILLYKDHQTGAISNSPLPSKQRALKKSRPMSERFKNLININHDNEKVDFKSKIPSILNSYDMDNNFSFVSGEFSFLNDNFDLNNNSNEFRSQESLSYSKDGRDEEDDEGIPNFMNPVDISALPNLLEDVFKLSNRENSIGSTNNNNNLNLGIDKAIKKEKKLVKKHVPPSKPLPTPPQVNSEKKYKKKEPVPKKPLPSIPIKEF